jgi:hypothetical protein
MGTYLTGEVSVIHNGTTADFNNFVYSAIYFNGTGPFTINGNAGITGVVGETLEVIVDASTTILSANNFLLLGNPKPTEIQSPTGLLSATTTTFQNNTGIVETYQYIDIKTGKPIQSQS